MQTLKNYLKKRFKVFKFIRIKIRKIKLSSLSEKMSEIQTIFKNVSWVTSSQVITNLCAFIWTILIARYLGVNDYGILSFAISFTAILAMGTDIGMSTFTTRELSKDREKTHKFINNVIPFKIVLSIGLFLIVAIVLFVLGYDKLIIEVSLIMVIENVFICMINFINGVFQAYENQKYYAIGSMIYSILLVIFTFGILFFDLGLIAVAISYTLAYFFNLAYVSFHLNKKFGFPKFEYDFPFWIQTAKRSIPFGLSLFFYTIYFYIDVVMIQFFSGDFGAGIYNASYKIISVFAAFYVIYTAVIFPLMSKLYAENTNLLKISFEQSIKYSVLILLPISIGVYFYSPTIINLIYGSEYALASTSMQILIWTIIFLFITGVTSSLLNAIDKEVAVTKIYIIAAIFNIVLNYFAISLWSYNGAALTTVLSIILTLSLMLLLISKTEYKPDISLFKSVIKLVFCGAILSIIFYFINVSIWLAIPIGLVVYVVSLFLTRSIDDTDRYIVKELLGK